MQGVKIEGLENTLRWADKAPKELLKDSKKAVRAGARQSLKVMKPKIPTRWRKLLKVVVKKSVKNETSAAVGLFNDKSQAGGHQNNPDSPVTDWFKAYWANYGTLQHRDPGHDFDYPVKPAKIISNYDYWRRHKRSAQKQVENRRRNNEGQRAQNFFENAAATANAEYLKGFKKSLEKQGYTLK